MADDTTGRAPRDAALVAELEGALDAARQQQALLRSSLITAARYLAGDPSG